MQRNNFVLCKSWIKTIFRMLKMIRFVALASLPALLLLSVLYARGSLLFQDYKLYTILATLIWFGGILLAGWLQPKEKDRGN